MSGGYRHRRWWEGMVTAEVAAETAPQVALDALRTVLGARTAAG